MFKKVYDVMFKKVYAVTCEQIYEVSFTLLMSPLFFPFKTGFNTVPIALKPKDGGTPAWTKFSIILLGFREDIKSNVLRKPYEFVPAVSVKLLFEV